MKQKLANGKYLKHAIMRINWKGFLIIVAAHIMYRRNILAKLAYYIARSDTK